MLYKHIPEESPLCRYDQIEENNVNDTPRIRRDVVVAILYDAHLFRLLISNKQHKAT